MSRLIEYLIIDMKHKPNIFYKYSHWWCGIQASLYRADGKTPQEAYNKWHKLYE